MKEKIEYYVRAQVAIWPASFEMRSHRSAAVYRFIVDSLKV